MTHALTTTHGTSRSPEPEDHERPSGRLGDRAANVTTDLHIALLTGTRPEIELHFRQVISLGREARGESGLAVKIRNSPSLEVVGYGQILIVAHQKVKNGSLCFFRPVFIVVPIDGQEKAWSIGILAEIEDIGRFRQKVERGGDCPYRLVSHHLVCRASWCRHHASRRSRHHPESHQLNPSVFGKADASFTKSREAA